jgi:hypothetical protein
MNTLSPNSWQISESISEEVPWRRIFLFYFRDIFSRGLREKLPSGLLLPFYFGNLALFLEQCILYNQSTALKGPTFLILSKNKQHTVQYVPTVL